MIENRARVPKFIPIERVTKTAHYPGDPSSSPDMKADEALWKEIDRRYGAFYEPPPVAHLPEEPKTLSDKQMVMVAMYIGERSTKEIAEELKLTTAAVNTALMKAKNIMGIEPRTRFCTAQIQIIKYLSEH